MASAAPEDGFAQPFSIRIEDEVLSDLRARIRQTRWPDQVPGIGWQQGTEPGPVVDILNVRRAVPALGAVLVAGEAPARRADVALRSGPECRFSVPPRG